MSNLSKPDDNFDPIYQRIRDMLKRGRNQALQSENPQISQIFTD